MIKTFGQAPPPPTFFEKLKSGLAKSTGALGDNITVIFT
jgi:fused signal recognition particle receptor